MNFSRVVLFTLFFLLLLQTVFAQVPCPVRVSSSPVSDAEVAEALHNPLPKASAEPLPIKPVEEDKLASLAVELEKLRRGVPAKPPPLRAVTELVPPAKTIPEQLIAYYSKLFRIPEEQLVVYNKFVRVATINGRPVTRSEVFLIGVKDGKGLRPALAAKIYVRQSKIDNPLYDIEALASLKGKQPVPELLDAARINHPYKSNAVLLTTTVAPGRDFNFLFNAVRTATDTGIRESLLARLYKQVYRMGEQLGKFHKENAGVKEYFPTTPFRTDITEFIHHVRILQTVGKLDSDMAEAMVRNIEQLATQLEREGVSTRLSHGDLNPGNVFIGGEEVSFIDIGTLGHMNPGNDLGRFVMSLSREEAGGHLPSPVVQKLRELFIRGYKSTTDVPANEVALTTDLYEASRFILRYGLEKDASVKGKLLERILALLKVEKPAPGNVAAPSTSSRTPSLLSDEATGGYADTGASSASSPAMSGTTGTVG